MTALTEGAPAPGFTATATARDGDKAVSLEEFKGKQAVVLYFYPKDDTPGCTTEACSFRDQSKEFEAAGAAILGVSPDSTKAHAKFRDKFALPFPLVADTDHAIAEAYGVWGEKRMYGRAYMGVLRTTFVIGKDGAIRKIFPNVKVDQHAADVLAAVKEL